MFYIIKFYPAVIFIFHIIESYHDFNVIVFGRDRFSEKAQQANRKWHKIDVIQWGAIYTFIGIIFYAHTNDLIFLLISLIVPVLIRWVTLDTSLNRLNDMPFYYLSQDGIDGFIRKRFRDRLKLAYFFKFALFFFALWMHMHYVNNNIK